jgi:phosphatidylglycerophosphate synthase
MADENNDRSTAIEQIVRLKERDWIRAVMLALPEWITPNRVTYFRGALSVPTIALVLIEMYCLALAIFVVAMLLDFVDGALAVARDEMSDLGAFLDPLFDKITVVALLGALANVIPFGIPLLTTVLITGVSLTCIRVKRLKDYRGGVTCEANIKAYPAGKMKLLAEVIGISVILIGLALNVTAIVGVGSAVLCTAAILGLLSLLSQLRRPKSIKSK